MTPEQRVVVGSYAPADEPGISVFALDEAAATLRLETSVSGIRNPSFLALGAAGNNLFAVSETGLASDGTQGAVHALRIDRGEGAFGLAPLNERSTGGDHPCHVGIDPSHRWLAVANYGSGDIAVFSITSDGPLGETAATARHTGTGPNASRQEGPHAHAAVFAPDGRYLLVADLGIDRIVVYAFGPGDGSLARHRSVPTAPGAGPRHMVFHPDGNQLFVVNELDSTVTRYRYDAETADLDELQTISSLPQPLPHSTAAAIHVAPTGRYLYVSNRGHDSIAAFAIEPHGGLVRTAVRSCGGEWPRSFAITPSGRHLIVANRHSNQIVLLPLLAGGADIGEPAASAAVPQPSHIVFA